MAVQRIGTVPHGLRHLLGLTGGQNPTEFVDTVNTVIRAEPFYLAGHLRRQGQSGNVQNVNDTLTLSAAPGRGWWLVAIEAHIAVGAIGEQAAFSLQLVVPDTATPSIITATRIAGSPTMTAIAATARLSFGIVLPQPVMLLPSASVQMIVNDINVAVARTGAIEAVFYEFDL